MTNGTTVRLAFRIGYLGDAYHGSQIQPDVKTVQGELVRVFQKLKWLDKDEEEHNLVLSSRTDAGVHVRVNGGVVRIKRELWEVLTPRKMIRALDDRLPKDIAFLDVTEVDESWNPRLAEHRVYRYRLEGIEFWNHPGDIFNEWLQIFVGTYDARNFARLEEGKNPLRTILSCEPWVVDGRVDWLILWGVHWPSMPLDTETVEIQCFSKPPEGPAVERTMRKRWREAARHEQKSILHNEWARLGELPIVRHR